MRREEFRIGAEFWTATGPWRCTDVGTRTIVAVKLGPTEITRIRIDDNGDKHQTTTISDNTSLLNGPSYAVAETVFDEDDLEGCYPTQAEMLVNQADNSPPTAAEDPIS